MLSASENSLHRGKEVSYKMAGECTAKSGPFFFPVLFLLKFIGWSHRFKASEPFSLDGLLFFLKILKSSCFSETGVSFCLFFPFAFECSGVLDGKLPKMSL